MQLNEYRGAPATGKTIRLHQTTREAGQGEHQIIIGYAKKPSDLEQLVRRRISQGDKVICIDDCSEQQIERLRLLKGDLPCDLTIHAVVAN